MRVKYPAPEYPFSDGLCKYMDSSPDFYASLKLVNTERFEFLRRILTSHTPSTHPKNEDQVIGFWYADKENIRNQEGYFFKQDFVVNIKKEDRYFLSYTIEKFVNNKDVLPIENFFRDYGENGTFYHNGIRWQHNYNSIDNLPDDECLRNEAEKILCSLTTKT